MELPITVDTMTARIVTARSYSTDSMAQLAILMSTLEYLAERVQMLENLVQELNPGADLSG